MVIGASSQDLTHEDLRELLKASMQNTISLTAHVEKQAEKINEVLSKLVEAEEKILDLKRKVSESDYRLDEAMNDMEIATKGVWDLHKELATSKKDISKEIQELGERQSQTTKAAEELTTRVETVERRQIAINETSMEIITRVETVEDISGTWPEGKYCILASGECPPNFTRHYAHMKAISTYAASDTYIRVDSFGDSAFRCHGPCGKYPNWYGEIIITSCCK